MRRTLAVVIVLVLVVSAGPALAGTYRWIDRNGTVTYSDRPPQQEQVAPAPEEAPGAAAARRPIHPLADELLELCGLKRQMAAMSTQARAQLGTNLGQLAAADRSAVDAVAARLFSAEALYAIAIEEFSQHVDDAKIEPVRGWYRSPLGRRITEIEIAFSAVDRQRELAQFLAELTERPPAQTRVALLQRLDAAAGTTEMGVEVIVAIAQAMVRIADPYLPQDKRLKPGQLEAQARQLRLLTLEMLRQGNTLSSLYLYRAVDDADLARYIKFLESEPGSWFGTAVRRAIVRAVALTIERTAVELVRVVPPERWGAAGAFKKPTLSPPGRNL